MRLTTWNVNGIRNPFSYPPWNTARSFPAMFEILGSDIVVMQELKIQRKDLKDDMVLLDGWDCYFSLPKHKKGYSGVAVYTKNATCAPIKAEEGLLGVLPCPSGTPYRELPTTQNIGSYPSESQIGDSSVDLTALDAEGRCVVLEFPAFVLLGVYSPANSNGLRDDFRHWFLQVLDCRIRNLIRDGKRVVLVGDLNISRDEIDSASAADDIKKSSMTHEEYISTPNRRIFNQILIGGEVVGDRDSGREAGVLFDTTRIFHPERRGMYTHWEQKINARPGNFGGRIDFVLVAENMLSWVQDANIQEGLLGSDHCPVYVDFKDVVTIDEEEYRLADVMSSSGVFKKGIRQIDWKLTNTPAFSGRRLPEFDKRRSIKSMFAAPRSQQDFSQAESNNGMLAEEISSPIKLQSLEDGFISPEKRSSQQDPSTTNTRGNNTSKRKASIDEGRSVKQPRSGSPAAMEKGQRSLKGFFQAAEKNSDTSNYSFSMRSVQQDGSSTPVKNLTEEWLTAEEFEVGRSAKQDDPAQVNVQGQDYQLDPHKDPALDSRSISPSPSMIEAQFATAEETQRSWSSLFTRPVAPLCEGHNEPCKTMQTKKKGSNQGRSFWMCARPLGPSGNKERGTQWRCPTFIWCSEWDGKKDRK